VKHDDNLTDAEVLALAALLSAVRSEDWETARALAAQPSLATAQAKLLRQRVEVS
jgi:hypothetical protein